MITLRHLDAVQPCRFGRPGPTPNPATAPTHPTPAAPAPAPRRRGLSVPRPPAAPLGAPRPHQASLLTPLAPPAPPGPGRSRSASPAPREPAYGADRRAYARLTACLVPLAEPPQRGSPAALAPADPRRRLTAADHSTMHRFMASIDPFGVCNHPYRAFLTAEERAGLTSLASPSPAYDAIFAQFDMAPSPHKTYQTLLESIAYGSDAQAMSAAQVPKLIHWIWLGAVLTDITRLSNIAHLKANNKDFRGCLWTHSACRASADFAHLQQWAIAHDIIVLPIDKIFSGSRDTPIFPLRNREALDSQWGAVSDMMRVHILDVFGGVYVDADNKPLEALWSEETTSSDPTSDSSDDSASADPSTENSPRSKPTDRSFAAAVVTPLETAGSASSTSSTRLSRLGWTRTPAALPRSAGVTEANSIQLSLLLKDAGFAWPCYRRNAACAESLAWNNDVLASVPRHPIFSAYHTQVITRYATPHCSRRAGDTFAAKILPYEYRCKPKNSASDAATDHDYRKIPTLRRVVRLTGPYALAQAVTLWQQAARLTAANVHAPELDFVDKGGVQNSFVRLRERTPSGSVDEEVVALFAYCQYWWDSFLHAPHRKHLEERLQRIERAGLARAGLRDLLEEMVSNPSSGVMAGMVSGQTWPPHLIAFLGGSPQPAPSPDRAAAL